MSEQRLKLERDAERDGRRVAEQRIEELERELEEARELVIRQGHTVRQWDEELSVMQGRAETAERRYAELWDAVRRTLCDLDGAVMGALPAQSVRDLQDLLDRLEAERG